MTTHINYWVIGDVQGCLHSLKHLLAHPVLHNDPHAHFIFAGDLINRGPDNLGVLNYIHDLGERARCVLGNHDIHFLSVAAGVRQANKYDSFHDILNSPKRDFWVDWLRHQPLLIEADDHLIVHAGVAPCWSLAELRHIARDIEAVLQSDDWHQHILRLFGNEPALWSDKLQGDDRLRYGINVLTRIRYVHSNGALDFDTKSTPEAAPAHLLPWFCLPRQIPNPIVFGHWSTLGLLQDHGVYALDTGALWGGQLSAMRLPDHQVVQVPAQERPLKPF